MKLGLIFVCENNSFSLGDLTFETGKIKKPEIKLKLKIKCINDTTINSWCVSLSFILPSKNI